MSTYKRITKKRNKRVPGFDDFRHYHKTIEALAETDKIMVEIVEVVADKI